MSMIESYTNLTNDEFEAAIEWRKARFLDILYHLNGASTLDGQDKSSAVIQLQEALDELVSDTDALKAKFAEIVHPKS